MTKKDIVKEVSNNNGNGEALQSIANTMAILADRIEDMEDRVQQNTAAGQALLQMVNLFYDTNDKHIAELSYISPLSSRPFAEALTMDALLDADVQSGEVSLNKKLILNYLRLQRSVRGRHFALGMPVLQEQVTSQNEKSEEFEAGRE